MKKIISLMAFLMFAILMITGCSNKGSVRGYTKNETEASAQTHLSEGNKEDSTEASDEIFFGKVKAIIGNEIEIEVGAAPDWDGNSGDKGIKPEDKKKPGVPMIKVKENETPPGFEDYYAPDPDDPIYGKDGEINLTYTGESRSLIIPAGTDIRNILGKKDTLDSIKKGSIVMIKPKVIDGKDAGIDKLTILS